MNREYIIEIMHAELIHGSPFNDPYLREEIVRCRDCASYSGEDDAVYPKWCMEMNVAGVEPNGFCAWACRRSDKE